MDGEFLVDIVGTFGKCKGGQGSILPVRGNPAYDNRPAPSAGYRSAAASKRLAAKLPRDSTSTDEIRRELEIWAKLPSHENVASLENVGCFIFRGERLPLHLVAFAEYNLEEYIRHRQQPDATADAALQAVDYAELRRWVAGPLEWLIQISRGVRFLHLNSIIHTDIKPNNVLGTPCRSTLPI